MRKLQISKDTLPKTIDAIINAESYDELTYYNNKLICIILSPLMFIFAAAYFVINISYTIKPMKIIILQFFIFILLGISFEIMKRAKKRVVLTTHLVALLSSILFMSFAIEFYSFLGPSIWILGLILLTIGILHNSRAMLIYTGVTFFITGLGLQYYDLQKNEYAYPGYSYTMTFFFILIFLFAFAIHTINTKRMKAIRSKIKEANVQISQRKKAEQDMKKMALSDELTQLPNKRQFLAKLNQAIEATNISTSNLFVIFLDLDSFKKVNDSLGHTCGDILLKSAGQRFVKSVREQDVVARVGGDEFLIMIHDASISEVEQIANHILDQISQTFNINDHKIKVSCSIGISKYATDKDDADLLILQADRAMYKAKEEGKNRYIIYSTDLDTQIEKEIVIVNSLESALANDEFELYYQPQMDGSTKEILGFEALLRWNHPTLGFVYPNDFISIAEQNGMMDTIGEWVLRTACHQNVQWQKNDVITTTIAVNLSVVQFRNPKLPELITSILQETGLDSQYLELEITESILIEDFDLVKQHLKHIRSNGVKISIDDFGTGYSSMNYLRDLPVDRIKIPMNFIHGIDNNDKDESIITMILALAGSLGLGVVAEGVESVSQLEFLQNHFCESYQGYYFCKPVPNQHIEKLCKKH